MPRSRGVEAPRKSVEQVLSELRPVWEAWAATLGGSAPDGWRVGAAYLRESHRESMDGYSPPGQFKGILEDAARNHIWIPWENVFLDNISGRHDQRPAFLNMMDLARAGAIQVIVVFHSSRFARNVGISRKWKEELRRRGVEVRALNIQMDTSTAQGRLMEHVQEAFDQYQSDSTGDWIVIGLRDKHEQGLPNGLLPETYYRDAAGAIRPHPELSKIVLDGARLYLTAPGNHGMGWLAQWSDEQGHRTPSGRRLTKEWWRNTLRNPLCAGYVHYRRKRGNKELKRAAFDGFMDLEMFQAVQQRRERHTHRPGERPSYNTYVLSGARCSCGGKVTAASGERLRCRSAVDHAGCSERSVRAADLEAQVRAALPEFVGLPDALKPRLVALIRAKLGRGSDPAKTTRLRKAIHKLNQSWQWDAIEDEAEYRTEVERLQDELRRAEQQPEEARILEAIKLAQDLPTLWDVASPERRKELFWTMFERATISGGRVKALRPRPEIAPLVALRLHICGPDRIRTGDLVLDRDVC